ncbi:hypothetical protein MALGJ_17320 [Mycolicibacter algericus]|uniref:protein adenylyltransferase n=1 Tax=Mycolicibacter algericus TaxID=1288388 RepID=A0A7I9Y8Q0_MYCAL|nr:hypothetical protein MALGJ_17320 [Mycolicibacter algericus]
MRCGRQTFVTASRPSSATATAPYLTAIHRHLFQDVYEWAGDLRTVGIEKGDESFCPPGSISQPMDHVATEIHRLKRLTTVPEASLPRTIAESPRRVRRRDIVKTCGSVIFRRPPIRRLRARPSTVWG